jgi:hypothetical protein
MVVTPSLGEFSDRPNAPVELTGRVAPRSIALCRPRVPPCSTPNIQSQWSTQRFNSQTSDRTRCSTDRTRYTRCLVRVQYGSTHDRTCPVKRDWMCLIDLAIYCSSRRLNGRVGPASDRTRQCETLARALLQQLLLTGRAGPPWIVSGPASDRSFSVISILDFHHLFLPPA